MDLQYSLYKSDLKFRDLLYLNPWDLVYILSDVLGEQRNRMQSLLDPEDPLKANMPKCRDSLIYELTTHRTQLTLLGKSFME